MKTLAYMATGLASVFMGSAARAKVTKLEITSKQPYGAFQSGDYVRWDGRIVGELEPTESLIPDLDKATRNANGMVEYLPFPTTKDAAKDKRPSLAERYKDNNDYLNRIRGAARDAEAAGFLLPEDAAVIVNSAASSPIFGQAPPSGPPR
jgi:hypothetical protein